MTKLCVNYDGQGYIHVIGAPQNVTECPYIITESGNQVIELYPFNLSMEEGAAIAAAIIAVWGVGVIFNLIRKTMNT